MVASGFSERIAANLDRGGEDGAGRFVTACLGFFHEDAGRLGADRPEFCHDLGAVTLQRVEERARAAFGHLFCGLDDRLVARATTEIALQRHLDLGAVRLVVGKPEAIERHDEARRAEAALRAMTVDHGLLHRMQRAVLGRQMLDRHHMGAVEGAQEPYTGVDALVAQPVFGEASDQHRAGAAIAFRASFLRARQPPLQAKMVEKRVRRCEISKRDVFSVEDEADG